MLCTVMVSLFIRYSSLRLFCRPNKTRPVGFTSQNTNHHPNRSVQDCDRMRIEVETALLFAFRHRTISANLPTWPDVAPPSHVATSIVSIRAMPRRQTYDAPTVRHTHSDLPISAGSDGTRLSLGSVGPTTNPILSSRRRISCEIGRAHV